MTEPPVLCARLKGKELHLQALLQLLVLLAPPHLVLFHQGLRLPLRLLQELQLGQLALLLLLQSLKPLQLLVLGLALLLLLLALFAPFKL